MEKKKTGKKKKKVGKFAETRPKKVWARSEKKFFFASETLRCERKQKITNKVRDLTSVGIDVWLYNLSPNVDWQLGL